MSNDKNDKNDAKTKQQNKQNENAQTTDRSELIIAIIVCIVIFTGTYFLTNYLYFDDQNVLINAKKLELAQLKTNVKNLEQIRDNRLELDKEINQTNEAYKALSPLIPEKKELPQILERIQRNAIDRGLLLNDFSPRNAVNSQGALNEIPVFVEVTGDDQALKLYLSSLNQLERILHINNLKFKRLTDEQNKDKIKAQINLSAFISNIPNSDLNKTANTNK